MYVGLFSESGDTPKCLMLFCSVSTTPCPSLCRLSTATFNCHVYPGEG